MGNLIANMSMSLDGFVEDRAGGVDDVFAWMAAISESSASAEYQRTARAGVGALIAGRRLFDLAQGWGGRHPLDVPVFVVTHRPPDDWAHPDAPFTFVTDGVASAVEQARAVAGDRDVAVASPDITRQCLDLGLLDAIAVDLVAVLLGGGKPFFAGLASAPIKLTDPVVVEGAGVTHLLYRLDRSGQGSR
ncbi:MAG TPA: dihydrofolate reductase family protein [Blastococcus sp.]|nr:dihydrofolate reductase family protein [Blastococcus sp.]